MATKLISFRLTDEAMAALQLRKEGKESPALVAQRLLSEVLGVSAKSAPTESAIADTSFVDNIVDNIVNSERFSEVLGNKLASIITTQNGKFAEIEQMVAELREAINLRAEPDATALQTQQDDAGLVEPEDEVNDAEQDIPTEMVPPLEDMSVITPDAETDLTDYGINNGDEALETDVIDVEFKEVTDQVALHPAITDAVEVDAPLPNPSALQLKAAEKKKPLHARITDALKAHGAQQLKTAEIIELAGISPKQQSSVCPELNRMVKKGWLICEYSKEKRCNLYSLNHVEEPQKFPLLAMLNA